MKKLSLTLLVLIFAQCIWAGEDLTLAPKDSLERPPVDHPWHKAPAYIVLPTIIYDAGQAILEFLGVTDIGPVSYAIKDEDEATVLSGSFIILQDDSDIVSIASLPAGTYTLEIAIGSRAYVGEFTVEAE